MEDSERKMSPTTMVGSGGVMSSHKKEGVDELEACLANMLHQHQISTASVRHQTEIAKKEAMRAGTRVSEVLVEAVNGGVEECFLTEKQIELEIRLLSATVARFHKQTHQWLCASRDLNNAIKEIGDFENWINVMLFDCHNITAAIHPEMECPTFSQISQPVHGNLLTLVEVSNKNKGTVDKLLLDLLRKGDSGKKYVQGSRSVKVNYQINLDNYYKKVTTSGARLQAFQANSKRSKKHMSLKLLKKVRLLDLEESHKYELFKAMHGMWKEYVLQLLKNIGENKVVAVLFGANLHGAILRVVRCKIDSFIGVLGIMIRETAETFGIITQDDKFRVVPKRNSVFVLQADCWGITLLGDKLVSRKLGL